MNFPFKAPTLPDDLLEQLRRSYDAQIPTSDERRFTRRAIFTAADLSYEGGLPALERSDEPYSVLLADLSRTGFRILHSEQLYPGELVSVRFADKHLRLQVARCRKMIAGCFDIGCTFLAGKGGGVGSAGE